MLYEPGFAMVASRFVRYSGRALTVLTIAGGLVSAVSPPLAAWLVDALSAGAVHDPWGGYGPVLWLLVAAAVGAAVTARRTDGGGRVAA